MRERDAQLGFESAVVMFNISLRKPVVFQGDLGNSAITREPVMKEFSQRYFPPP